MNREEISPTLDNLSIGGGSVSSEYDRGLKAMGLGELSSNLELHAREVWLVGFLGLSSILAACRAEGRPTQSEALDSVADQPPTLIDEMSDQGAVEVATAEFQVDVSLLESTEVFTQEPELTAEIAVTPTPAVTVDQGLPLEHFDGNNGEPIILWRNEVANDLVNHLASNGIAIEGGADSVEVMRDYDENGVFRWMPFVKTEEGSKVFTGHLGQVVDEETGQLKDELKGVCEVDVGKLMESGIIESEDELQLDVNYSEDSQGVKIPRFTVKKNGESLMGCTDLRTDHSLFVAFTDRLLSQNPPMVPEFPELPEGAVTWVLVVDGETAQWLLMQDIGGDPSFVLVDGQWERVQAFNVAQGKLGHWNDEGWEFEDQPIPEEIAASLGESAMIEGVEQGEDGRWSVIVDGKVKFFVSEEEGEVIVSPLPTPTPEPTPIPTATPIPPTPTETPIPPPTATLEPTQPPPPPTAVPTEVPPTPEPAEVPPMIAGQMPSLEQISQCWGEFSQPHNWLTEARDKGGVYGKVTSKVVDMVIGVQDKLDGRISTKSLDNVVRIILRQVTNANDYPFARSSFEQFLIDDYDERVAIFYALPVGAEVWVTHWDMIGGDVMFVNCHAVRP